MLFNFEPIKLSACYGFQIFITYQRSRNTQEEVTWRCPTQARKRKLRVLRTFEIVAASFCNHKSTGQGVNHSTFNQLPEAQDFLVTWLFLAGRWSATCSFFNHWGYERVHRVQSQWNFVVLKVIFYTKRYEFFVKLHGHAKHVASIVFSR